MGETVLYDVARFAVSADTESLRERVQLVERDGVLWRRVGESQTRCAGDVAATIAADPLLNEVRADEVTRITAATVAMHDLPLALRIPGDGYDFDESVWSEAMVHEHLDCSDGADVRGVYRVLYVNEERWGAFTTTDGERLLPEGDEAFVPKLDPCWAALSFCETDHPMSDPADECAIGLVTPGVVVQTWESPNEGTEVEVYPRATDDASAIVGWLQDNSLIVRLSTCNAEMDVMMVRLFFEAGVNGRNGQLVTGDELAPDLDVDADESLGAHASSEWHLSLRLDSATLTAALEQLAEHDARYADVIVGHVAD